MSATPDKPFILAEITLSDLFPRKVAKKIRSRRKAKKAVPRKNATEYGWTVGDREFCDTDTAAGKREYDSRIDKMVIRQGGWCACGLALRTLTTDTYTIGHRPTFGHDIPRGNGGMNRDDRITNADGKPMNHAECWKCNSEKGSKRNEEAE